MGTRNAHSETWFQHLNLFEIFKATTLLMLAVLLVSVGSASHPTSLSAYLSFSGIMALQLAEVFAPLFWELTDISGWKSLALRISIFMQLLLASMLVAVTDGSGSIYELVYLLPIISAATKLTGRDVVLTVAAAVLAMGGFIISGEQLSPLATHVKEFQDAVSAMVYFTMAGLLVYFFSQSERQKREQLQSLADTLAQTNDELRHAQAQLTERLVQVTKMEERLQKVSQMEVLGELAGQVAHEIRNPLGIIRGAAEMLAGRITDISTSRHIKVLLEESDRVNKAVEGVLRLGGSLSLNKAPVQLSVLLKSVMEVSSTWPIAQRVEVRLASNLPDIVVVGDFDLLHQSLANLIRNACESMQNGGTVSVSYSRLAGGHMVNISIADNGIGLSKDELQRLGEPFYTKRKGGIGLGFSLAQKIIVRHGGTLQVTSEQGRGTTVTVSLLVEGAL
jgi:signal transduction histidine kinase